MRILTLIFLFLTSFLSASNLIIQYPELKKEYYLNETVSIDIKVISPVKKTLKFIITPSDVKYKIERKNPFVYILHLTYKNTKKPVVLKIYLGSRLLEKIVLNSLYETKQLPNVKNFSNVLAEELNVTNVIASSYDQAKNLVSFTLSGKNANLKDFTLHYDDENLTLNSPNTANYVTTLPKNIKKLEFYYFNTTKDKYQKITVPVKIKSETISTQTDINPEEESFFTPLNILLLTAAAVLVVLYFIYKRLFLILLAAVLGAVSIYLNLPKGEALLLKNTKVYILPTKNSTPFYTVPMDMKVKILKKTSRYIKVKINNKTGWVRNADIK